MGVNRHKPPFTPLVNSLPHARGGLLSLVALLGVAHAATLYVGAGEAYTTIQSAIDASWNGDTVIVRDGIYSGDGNQSISFRRRAIHLRSENGPSGCVIQQTVQTVEYGFKMDRGEGEGSIIQGFTITGFKVAVLCAQSSPTIRDNVITDNGGGSGWAISCTNSSAIILNNRITGNRAGGVTANGGAPQIIGNTISGNTTQSAGKGIYCSRAGGLILDNQIDLNSGTSGYGGGIYASNSPSLLIASNTICANTALAGGGVSCLGDYGETLLVLNNVIADNTATYVGGGIYSERCSPVITNNTIAGNSVSGSGDMLGGGALAATGYSWPSITSTILWGNTVSAPSRSSSPASSSATWRMSFRYASMNVSPVHKTCGPSALRP